MVIDDTIDRSPVRSRSSGHGAFQQSIRAAGHDLIADEPVSRGGLGAGPDPYDLLSAALAACTSMTIRLYAERKRLTLPAYAVEVSHDRVHALDCTSCLAGTDSRIDRFVVRIAVDGIVNIDLRTKILEIAGKCPVHRTLASASLITTSIEPPADIGEQFADAQGNR